MSDESGFDPDIGGQNDTRDWDRLIAALARRQHGMVARSQLRERGMRGRAIDHRVECGRLHVIHRGVYAVGHRAIPKRGWLMAAVLAGGRGAVLSHRSAAELWGLRRSAGAPIEITVPGSSGQRPGLLPHRAKLAPDEVTILDGIPVTTVPRTLLDLAAVLPASRVERAIHEAEVLRLTDALSLEDLLERHPGRRGTAAMRKMIETARRGAEITRSELEDRFLTLIAKENLPRPQLNVQVGGFEVDCLWREERVIVELDGYATHATRKGFERDRARDRQLNAAGWRVIRITWRQLHDDPHGLTADLRALLAT